MAEPQRKESQELLVGHAMIGDTLSTPILQCDLLKEIEILHKEDAWLHGTGPSSATLVKHADLRIVLIALRAKTSMPQHKTVARISIQTVAGHVRLRLPGRVIDLPAGQLLVLDHGVAHDVEAEEDSALLLTLSWPRGEEAAGGKKQA